MPQLVSQMTIMMTITSYRQKTIKDSYMTCVINVFEMPLNNIWTKPCHFDEDISLSLKLKSVSVYNELPLVSYLHFAFINVLILEWWTTFAK